MNNNQFIVDLLASLDKQKSQKQINADIKQIEKLLNKISLIGTFSKGDTKKELNSYIVQLSNQINHIKLQAKLDNKKLQREVNESLKSMSFSDIDVNISDNKTKAKIQKVVAEAKNIVDRNPLSLNIEIKKDKLNNQLTTFLNKNSKIRESSVLLEEADTLRKVFSDIGDKKSITNATDQFQLFKSEVVATGFAGQSTTDKIKNMIGHVTKIGSAFGVASIGINQFFQSERNLKEMDTVLTEISKTSEMTKKQLVELGNASFDTANKYGQLAKNYLLGVQEMARSGYEDKAKELGEVSLLAQSAGNMTAEMANNYILATDAAYKYSGGIEQLTSALDGANYISNKNSASLTDIADGIRVSASYAANAGVEIDQLTAAEATMIAVTKRSGSEMGRAFRSILLNLQQVSGEFDGEVIDEEQLKKVEARCHSLGVELESLKNGVATLRNPMEVLKELADVYNSLPENSADKQGLISDLGGKYHANALTGLLSRWDLYEKMLSEYSQGTGSALTEAYKTADSWEGRLNQLQNSWDSFVNTLTNKDVVKGGISFLDGTIQAFEKLTGAIGTIPTLMTAVNASMAALNKDYGITQLFNQDSGKMDIQGNFMGIDFTAFKAQKKHFEEAADAIGKWNKYLNNGQTDLNDFGEAIVKNSAQFKAYLQTCSVDAPASLAGYKAYLNAAGVSTDALRLKTVLLTSAMSFGISIAIQAAISGISKMIQAQEESRQAAQEAANAYKDSTAAIEDYASKYQELHSELTNANTSEERQYEIKQQLLALQQELNAKYGDECGRLDLVTDAYTNQTQAIKELNKEKARNFLNENAKDIQKSKDKMLDTKKYTLGMNIGLEADGAASLKDIINKYAGKGIKINPDEASGTFSIVLEADAQDAHETINDFMSDVDKLRKENKDNPIFEDVFELSAAGLGESNKILEKHQEIFNQSLMAEITSSNDLSNKYQSAVDAAKAFNDAMVAGDDTAIQNARKGLDDVRNSLDLNSEDMQIFGRIFNDVLDQANTKVYDFSQKLKNGDYSNLLDGLKGRDPVDLKAAIDLDDDNDPFVKLMTHADEYGVSIDSVIEQLQRLGIVQDDLGESSEKMFEPVSKQDAIAKIQEMSEGFESLDKIMASMGDKKPFDFALLDDKNFKDNFSECGEAYEDFIETISNSPKDVEACQSAFDELVAAFINQSGVMNVLNEDTKGLVVSMLENMGVTNAEAIATDLLTAKQGALAAQKIMTANASFDMANASYAEIAALFNEAGQSGATRASLIDLLMAKINCSNTSIATDGDIQNLMALANAAGIAAAAVANAKQAMNPGNGVIRSDGAQNAVNQSVSDQLEAGINADKQKVYKYTPVSYSGGNATNSARGGSNGGNRGGGGGGSAKEAKEYSNEIDNAAQSIKILESQLDAFNGTLDDDNQPYEDQIATIDKLIAKQGELVNAYRDSLELYEQQWADAASKITEEQKNAITSGQQFDVSQFTSESEYNLVKDAQDAYNKVLDVQQDFNDESLQLQESYVQKYNARQKHLDNYLDTLKYSMDAIQDEIDQVDVLDGQVSEKSYKRLINLSKQQENYYRQKRNMAREEMNSAATNGDSERYYELKKEIAECDRALADCEKSQLEWNKSILEMPIKALEKANDELDEQLEKQEKLKDSYDSAISGVTDILDEQAEALDKEREASDKFYDDKIENLEKEKDAIQDEIDLIQKKNDETDRTIETEKKLKALEDAKNNKTIKKLVNGKWIWDVDHDAIRDAQKDYDDQLVDNNVNDLQNKQDGIDDNIDDLNDKKTDASDKIQEKIDALEEYRKKWDEITNAFEKEQNKQGAMDFFGMTEEQLRNALLNKNLDLITQINTSYTDAEMRMDELEKTKEKNEELIKTFEDYIKSWQNGTISIGEAKSAIQEIVSDNGIEIETIDARTFSVDNYRGSWDDTEDSIEDNLENINENEIESTEEEKEMWGTRIAQVTDFANSFYTVMDNVNTSFSIQMDTLVQKATEAASALEAQARRIKDAYSEMDKAESNNDSSSGNNKPSGSGTGSGSGSSSSSNNSGKPSGPASDPDYVNRKHHVGLKAGNAGNGNSPINREIANQLLAIANNPPKDGEVLKIVRGDEFILTNEQANDILKNANYSYNFTPVNIPEIAALPQQQPAQSISIDVGGVHVDHVDDIKKFANEMTTKFEPYMLQAMYRK